MKTLQRFEVERDESWFEKAEIIPYLNFKQEWDVAVIPPFGGAIARFRVKYKEKNVSVYLDFFDTLGYFGAPYWEVYNMENDTWRFALNDTKKLIDAIDGWLNT